MPRTLLVASLLLVACASPPPQGEAPPAPAPSRPTATNEARSHHSRPAADVDRWVGDRFVEGKRISIDFENADLDRVMVEIANRAGKEFYYSDPDALDESVTVALKDVPWNEAAEVVGLMARKTVYTYPEGIFLDWACSSYPDRPSWNDVRRLARPGLVRGR
jgi:hypothetical protein